MTNREQLMQEIIQKQDALIEVIWQEYVDLGLNIPEGTLSLKDDLTALNAKLEIINQLSGEPITDVKTITTTDNPDGSDVKLKECKDEKHKSTKINICAGCGSFPHGNPGHDITI